MHPVNYSLCDRTVTVYHREGSTVTRTVAEGCYYVWQDCLVAESWGDRPVRKFLLILPGAPQRVFAGDRIYDGIGPEEVDWDSFCPARVPGLSEAAYATPWYWEGQICHTEAGRK